MSTSLLIKAKASQKVLDEAFALALEIESKLSAYKESSDIVKINKQAGKTAVTIDEVTKEALSIALEIAHSTQGLYDPTIGALSHFAYQFGWRDEKLLSKQEAKSSAALVDYKQVVLEGDQAFLKKSRMALDLGGMGKGFAVMKIITFLKQKGIRKALVSLGGEVYGYGKVWKIAVAHPRHKTIAGLIRSTPTGMSVTTSGDYERYILDYEHHHILSSTTGLSKNYFASLTLISTTLDPARMDALNTALFQLPQEKHEALMQEYDLEFLLFDKKMNKSFSQTMKEYFTAL